MCEAKQWHLQMHVEPMELMELALLGKVVARIMDFDRKACPCFSSFVCSLQNLERSSVAYWP